MHVLVPMVPLLAVFAKENGDARVSLNDVCLKLKGISQEAFGRFLISLEPGQEVIFAAHDLLFTPPGWLSMGAVNKDDCLGVKIKAIKAPLTQCVDNMKALQKVLEVQQSASPALDALLSQRAPASAES